MAFILVPHLDPGHASMMTELLRRVTKLKVNEAQDGVKVKPNHVYVIPPNKDMSIYHGTDQTRAAEKDSRIKMPIDSFFRSLAEDQGEMAIGIILSGTGTDGTLGIRAIHGAGGMVMVQTPVPPSTRECLTVQWKPALSTTSFLRKRCPRNWRAY